MTLTDVSRHHDHTWTVAPEASVDHAPSLIDGATTIELAAGSCGIEYWIRNAAQGTLAGLVNGHRPGAAIPGWMRSPGPLRDAMIEEFGFRSIAEEKATRALTYLVATAPDIAGMEFFAGQLLDEARHASVFRGHVCELGVEASELAATIEAAAGHDRDAVLVPLEEFGLPVGRDDGDYIGGVAILTVLVEGVLAPAAELSERKWRLINPAGAQIERVAGIDEIRHLSVGSSIVADHIRRHPHDRARLMALIESGRALWAELPVIDLLYRRENLFQQGMTALADVIGDYQIWPGRRLVDTNPDERLLAAATWSQQMQDARLASMGLQA
ncbi:MAG: VlmB-like protein [Actinomycetota bacterium]|nr:VlmB-like protein [Actinomycetota bacterium]